MVDLNEVLLFAKVVETKSFTAAGDALGIPKSTVSRKVAQLEERLGVRLLQRTTRTLAPTDVGKAYYERCKQAVDQLTAAEQVIDELQSAPRGLLRVTTAVDVADSCLGGILAKFAKLYPDISVDLDASDRLVDLVEEGFDLAIRFGPLVSSSLTSKRLCEVQMFLCAAPSYLKEVGEPSKIQDLDKHRRVLFAPTSKIQSWTLTNGKDEIDFGRPARVISNNFSVVRNALIAGAGIGVCSEILVDNDIRRGRLVRVLPKWEVGKAAIFAVFPSRKHLSPKVEAFLRFLVKEFATAPWRQTD